MRYGPTTTSAAQCTRAASSGAAPPAKTKRSRLRRGTRGACLALEAAADRPHHGRAPKRETPLAGVVSSCSARADHNQRGKARTRSKLECCASSLETAIALASRRGTCLTLQAAADRLHRGRAPKKKGLSPAQCPLEGSGTTATSAGRRARATSWSAAPHP